MTIYIYIYIYIRIIQEISPKNLIIGSTVYSCTFFQWNQQWWGFYVLEDNQHYLLYWPQRLELFLYPMVIVFLLPKLSEIRSCKTHDSPFVKRFLTKKCFAVNMAHSSVNFIWFALLSHQKFHDRLLFLPWSTLFDLSTFLYPKTKYFFKIKIILFYKPVPNNAVFKFIEKIQKKCICFFKKIPIFIELTSYIYSPVGWGGALEYTDCISAEG